MQLPLASSGRQCVQQRLPRLGACFISPPPCPPHLRPSPQHPCLPPNAAYPPFPPLHRFVLQVPRLPFCPAPYLPALALPEGAIAWH